MLKLIHHQRPLGGALDDNIGWWTTTEPLIVADTFGSSLNQEIVVIWSKPVLTSPAVDSHDVCEILI